jgi:hypothetical protein
MADLPFPTPRLRGRLTIAVWLAVVCLSAPAPRAAPEYAISGRAAELEATVLARTPAGPITALDLLMFDEMSEQTLWAVPEEALLELKGLQGERHQAKIREAVERLAVTQALAADAGSWQPASDELRAMCIGAAEAVWAEMEIVPTIKIERADMHRYYLEHANDYLRRRRVQVRYIFKRVGLDDYAAVERTRTELERLAYQTRQGEIEFGSAARRQSDALSAADDGLLPPFYDGTYFETFESHAFNMESPGEVSEPFAGPDGLYLLQLVRTYPTRDIPIEEVWDEIGSELHRQHLRHYYGYEYRQLCDRLDVRDFSPLWAYQPLDAPVAIVGSKRLRRQDFIRFFGDPTNPDYTVRAGLVGAGIADWIEGEVVMQHLEGGPGMQHRWLHRARDLAVLVLRARAALARQVPMSDYATIADASRSLQESGAMDTYFNAYRLVSFEIAPGSDAELTPADRRAAARLAVFLEKQLREGMLRTEPTPTDLGEWRREALQDEEAGGVEAAISRLNEAIAATPWPNVETTIKDAGWLAPLPNAPLWRLLEGVEPGRFSRTQVVGDRNTLYLVFDRQPAGRQPWAETEVVRQLSFEASAQRLREQQRRRLVSQGAIRFPAE